MPLFELDFAARSWHMTGQTENDASDRFDLKIGEFDAELASTAEEASFWSFLDVESFKGQKGKLSVKGASEEASADLVREVADGEHPT